MRSFVRICLVSVVLAALAFFCEGLRTHCLSDTDFRITVQTSEHNITNPIQSAISFIKFSTVCVSGSTSTGQTAPRTVTGASGSPNRNAHIADLEFKILEFKTFHLPVAHQHSLTTLQKLRL